MLTVMVIWRAGLGLFPVLLDDLHTLCLKHRFHFLEGASNVGHLTVSKARPSLLLGGPHTCLETLQGVPCHLRLED